MFAIKCRNMSNNDAKTDFRDYTMEVKTITGADESVDTVTIFHRGHVIEERPKIEEIAAQTENSTTESPISDPDLSLQTAIQDFIQEIKSWDTAAPIVADETTMETVEIGDNNNALESFHDSTETSSCLVLQRRCPALTRKAAVPRIRYRWARGFRRSRANGYVKVPVCRISLEYPEGTELLPDELMFRTFPAQDDPAGTGNEDEDGSWNKKDDGEAPPACGTEDGGSDQQSRVCKLSRLACFCEFANLSESRGHQIAVSNVRSSDFDHIVPGFRVFVGRLDEAAINEWQEVQPVLSL